VDGQLRDDVLVPTSWGWGHRVGLTVDEFPALVPDPLAIIPVGEMWGRVFGVALRVVHVED